MNTETRVLVASQNLVKAEAVKQAFATYGMQTIVETSPEEILSGVSDQPLSLEETALGALNRIHAIRKHRGYDYYVSIEGGAYPLDLPHRQQWYESACAAVVDANEAEQPSIAYGPAYPIPSRLVSHLLSGKDLNQAMEHETGIHKIGSSIGFNGWLTDGKCDRKTGSSQAVLMALYGLKKS